MITIGFSLIVFSKLSLVSSIVGTAGILSKKGLQCTLDNHVRRPVRALAHRAVALRLAGCRARKLVRRARGQWPLVRAHGRPRSAPRAARGRRRDPAHARASRPTLGRSGDFPEPPRRALPCRPGGFAR